MVGIERVLRPLFGECEFEIASQPFHRRHRQGMGPNVLVTGWLFAVPKAAVILFASEGISLFWMGSAIFFANSASASEYPRNESKPLSPKGEGL